MANVTYKNVYKRFGDVTAVNNMNIEVADKEFLVLVGPSGCGKTTALRCLAGLEEITEVEIVLSTMLLRKTAISPWSFNRMLYILICLFMTTWHLV